MEPPISKGEWARMSNSDRVLSYLRSIAPLDATNAQIVSHTGIKPHQQVFMITRDLMHSGLIRGVQSGKEWRFSTSMDSQALRVAAQAAPHNAIAPLIKSSISPSEFERLARQAMETHFGTPLAADRMDGVRKVFDLVSHDHHIVGDAKYFSMVQGERLPPAKFSVIAEHVWLLEKTSAKRKFLVFGNDRRVPMEWLARYGNLARSVEFYFLDVAGKLELLNGEGAGHKVQSTTT
jgi:hypothetical protein